MLSILGHVAGLHFGLSGNVSVSGLTADQNVTCQGDVNLMSIQAGQLGIPEVIYYTHKNRHALPKQFEPRLRELNPTFSLEFYDDARARALISSYYGDRYLRIYDSIKNAAHRADFWRYLALYKFGGYYIDTDNEALVPLKDISRSFDFIFVISATEPKGTHVHNGFFATVPGNPILLQLATHMAEHPSPEAHYPLNKYLYYVRYFYELVNVSLAPVGGLVPLTEYNFMGMRISSLYHEFPRTYEIDAKGKLVVSQGTYKPRWRRSAKWPLYTLEPGFPFKMNLTTKEWHPIKNDVQSHTVTPLANSSSLGLFSEKGRECELMNAFRRF